RLLVQISPRRLFVTALATALLLGAFGFGWEFVRFGANDQTASRHLEAEVRRTVTARAREIELLATRVAREGPLIQSANSEPDRLWRLFGRLMDLVEGSTERISATAYVTAGPRGTYKVLAWSSGSAEDLPPDRLAGPRAVFAAPGFGGLRLVAVEPIELD